MNKFEEKKFDIPKLKGISDQTVEEHLKLYAGYVKNSNLISEKLEDLLNPVNGGPEKNAYLIGELQRRFAFEFCGMRNHECYFSSFKADSRGLDPSGPLYGAIAKEYGTFDEWLSRFKLLAQTRGIGWAMLCYDRGSNRVLNQWVDEHHLNQLASTHIVLALDMWEHAYVADYLPSGKKDYVEDFFDNLNWQVTEHNLTEAIR